MFIRMHITDMQVRQAENKYFKILRKRKDMSCDRHIFSVTILYKEITEDL